MFVLELRMSVRKARIIFLKLPGFAGDEANLRTDFVLFRAAVNHPVKVVKVLIESHSIVKMELYSRPK